MAFELRTTLPVEAASGLERLNLFPGRHLGEDEFDREQRYREARLAPLLAGRGPGIVSGLSVHLPVSSAGADAPDLIIDPGLAIDARGLAVGLSDQLRPRWVDLRLSGADGKPGPWLVESPERTDEETAPDGLYVLVLERQPERADPPTTEPSRRGELDPLRDTRWEWAARLVAHPLPLDPALPLPPLSADRRRIANAVTALYLPERIAEVERRGVAVALVLVRNRAVVWADPIAVRRDTSPGGARWTLLAELEEMFSVLASGPLSAQPFDFEAFRSAFKLEYLPAAGALPPKLLVNAASATPSCPFFPAHIGLELAVLPASQAGGLVRSEVTRAPLALLRQSGDRVRLFAVVRDEAYRPDLLNKPEPDAKMIDRLHRTYVRARVSWWAWCRQRRALYAAIGATFEPNASITFGEDNRVKLTTQELKRLGAVKMDDEAEIPESSESFVYAVIAREEQEALAEYPGHPNPPLPEPYASFKNPGSPVRFSEWKKTAELSAEEQEVLGSRPSATQHGYVIRRAFLAKFLDALSDDLDEARERVQILRDHALEHRSQFDAHSVNLASLVGGLGPDGLGLSVARWLPYVNMSQPEKPQEAMASLGVAANMMVEAKKEIAARSDAVLNANIAAAARAGTKTLAHPKIEATIAQVPEKASLVSSVREEAFGVLRHIRPDIYKMEHAHQAYRELYTRLELVMNRVTRSKWNSVKDSLDPEAATLPDDEPATWKTQFVNSLASRTPSGAGRLEKSSLAKIHPDKVLKDAFGAVIGSEKQHGPARINRDQTYRWLVALGQRQAALVGHVEALLRKWEAIVRAILAKQEEVRAAIAELDRQIASASSHLVHLDALRREAEDDYRMARVLADEDWGRTELQDEERRRLLENPVALVYARVRQTVTSLTLPDPLALRFRTRGEIVPGVAEDADLPIPEALDAFLDALWEVPFGDFVRLRGLGSFLPERSRLLALAAARSARLSARTASAESALYPRLATVAAQTHVLLNTVLATRFTPATSLVESQHSALRSLSIADLIGGPAGPLRNAAQALRRQWEQATAALLAALRRAPSSQRFDWAELAEQDQLRTDQPVTWPGFGGLFGAEDAASRLRTLVELVEWMFAQLAAEATSGGVNAVRNLVRAIIIHSAHGDAGEIARGRVLSLPARVHVGAALRVTLDREVALGTQLHLLGPTGAIAATLRVDDHDQYGTVARLLDIKTDSITTGLSVASVRS